MSRGQKVLDLLVLSIVILCLECFHCYVIIIDCLLTSFDTLYSSTDGCINKSLTYLLTYMPLCLLLFDNAVIMVTSNAHLNS